MKFSRKALSGVLMAGVLGTMMCSTAFAAGAADLADGEYKGTIHFLNGNGNGSYSMCDSIFAHQADVTIEGDDASIDFYVAYPVPSFPDQGTDGTIKDVQLTIDETTYDAISDIETKPEKEFDTAGALFGINAGDVLPTQVLSVTIPKATLDQAAEGGIATSAYVNVVMNTTQNFFMQITDLTPVETTGGDTETDEQSMEITANVEEKVSKPEYSVTVPSSVAMGTLSSTEDTEVGYNVDVKAANLGGTITVSAPGEGTLVNGQNKLAFTNQLDNNTVSEDTEGTALAGKITVKGADVASAAAGNYTGTTNFTITYAAAE